MNNFIESCKNVSWEIFKSHSEKDNIEIYESLESHPSLTDDKSAWNVFIFIGGSQFRCMFSTKFSTITLLNLASKRFYDVNEKEYIKSVKDFMKEYCNLFAGRLKASFETESDAFLSLPIISREYDLNVLFGESSNNITKSSWSLGENNMNIDIEFYYFEKKPIESYDKINNHLQSNDRNNTIDFF